MANHEQQDEQHEQVHQVIVIGAGFGGLGAVRALRERGVTDVAVLERAAGVGGVWRDNTYPNAACDVPSPLYSWSWARNPRWTRRYSQQPEILEYLRQAAGREGLLEHVRTGVEVTSCALEEERGEWRVESADGRSWRARAVVTAVGQLSQPVIPELPGRETFEGPAFHSAQWRHDLDLRGKRVAVVGTGASAIQFVPGIVDDVASLTVFQRSAPYVVPKPDQAFHALHSRLFEKLPFVLDAERGLTFWLSERLNAALEGGSLVGPPLLRALRGAWQLHLRRQVPDPALRAKLQPDYELGCKRLLFSNDWYPALARDHVDVVTEPVAEVVPQGVRDAAGDLHEVDVIIWGTGFAATEFLSPMTITGRQGLDLHEVWSDGARAHLGITVPGFPNLFCVYGPNTNLGGSSIIGMMESQADWIAEVVAHLEEQGGALAEVRSEVAEEFDTEMQQRLQRTVWATCDSWYRNGGRISTNWPGLVDEYRGRVREVDWSELEVIAVPSPV